MTTTTKPERRIVHMQARYVERSGAERWLHNTALCRVFPIKKEILVTQVESKVECLSCLRKIRARREASRPWWRKK